MTKNRLSDLNDHLFAQLERLADNDLNPDLIEVEAKRAAAIVSLGDQIVRNAGVQLKAAEIFAIHGERMMPFLPKIGKAD